jgi:hypothetical protein
MDPLPPNDPNNNGNNNSDRSAAKNVSQNRPRGPRNQLNENGEMEVFGGGNQGDQAAIMALFLMGVASWILREHCIC